MNQDREVQLTQSELRAVMESEMSALLQEVSDAMNKARDGAIIADSEVPVRDAVARFRQKLYEKAVQLKADKAAKAAFSPSAQRGRDVAARQGPSGRRPFDGQRNHSH